MTGFLHGGRIRGLIGSDLSAAAVELCERNLALLDSVGLNSRVEKLRQDLDAFRKVAHRQALESAGRLRAGLPPPLARLAFVADAADPDAVRAGLGELRPDIVITDFPYGRISGWRGRAAEGGAERAPFSDRLRTRLPRDDRRDRHLEGRTARACSLRAGRTLAGR